MKESKSVAVQVEEYVYEKVKKSDVTVKIPQEPIYYQEDNYRTVIGLFPQFATWLDYSVWEIQVVKITDKNIERTNIRTSTKELSEIISEFGFKNKSNEDHLKDEIVGCLKDFYSVDRVSKEVFENKYNIYIKNLSEITGI